jgi:membrane-associated protein
MDLLHQAVYLFLHLNENLAKIAGDYPNSIYGLLFLVIFCETGLVVTPFLPGDSLLFAVGALTAASNSPLPLPIWVVYVMLTFAALLGDNSNYWIGRFFGEKAFGKLMNQKHLDRTHEFYEKHGVLTLVIAQFVPIIRTFAPFVAGVGKMTYNRFVTFNLIGVLSWTTLFVWSGYWIGNLDFVHQNFHYVVLAIILVSVTPIIIEVAKMYFAKPLEVKKTQSKKKK